MPSSWYILICMWTYNIFISSIIFLFVYIVQYYMKLIGQQSVTWQHTAHYRFTNLTTLIRTLCSKNITMTLNVYQFLLHADAKLKLHK